MADSRERGGRRGTYVVAAATAMLLVTGVALIAIGMRGSSGPPQPDSDAADRQSAATPAPSTTEPDQEQEPNQKRDQQSADPPAANRVDFGPVLHASDPVALDIPSIDVHSTNIVDLGLAADGTMEVPTDASAPGWFTPGPAPGQFGPSVIAGHVDSDEGPAVFYRLGELSQGDEVEVTRADGTTGKFVIDRVQQFDKATFPTHEVYGDTTNRAELRLITCGGAYDEDEGYLGNVVAFGHLVGTT